MLSTGGLLLGVIGAVGGPDSLFKGLDEMKDVTATFDDRSTAGLLGLAVVKLLALVVAAGASFRGGRIFPALFVGVVAGLAVGQAFDQVPLPLAVACGTLGMLMATTRNGWLSIFMAVTAVPDMDLLPIVVLAALPAWLVVAGRPELTVHPPAAAAGSGRLR